MLIIDRLHPSNAQLLESFCLLQGGLPAVTELRASRQEEDWLAQPHTYALIALWGDHPAGFAVAGRLPKADARRGFCLWMSCWCCRSSGGRAWRRAC